MVKSSAQREAVLEQSTDNTMINRAAFNPYLNKRPDWQHDDFNFLQRDDAAAFHRSLPNYQATPLQHLPALAATLGVGDVFVKDEAQRFNVKAFKPLGASYAIYRLLKQRWENHFDSSFQPEHFQDKQRINTLGPLTFCAASDGNHGKAVAWTARLLRQEAVIYLPAHTALARIQAVEQEGARVALVPGSFDDCVKQCAADAETQGWQVVADTAYEGYLSIPKDIILGYRTLFQELAADAARFDMVFLQTGVGGFAAAGTSYFLSRFGHQGPKLICVEPSRADACYSSITTGQGRPIATTNNLQTIMAGLACGIPSLVAWPILRSGIDLFMSCSDDYAIQAMRVLQQQGIVSGESGAAGLAGLLALLQAPSLASSRDHLGLAKTSILLINTEGDTDPQHYQQVITS